MAKDLLDRAFVVSGVASTAGGALTSGRFYGVKSTAQDTFSLATGGTTGGLNRCVGVLLNNAASGQAVEVAISGGIVKMVSSGTITVGAQVAATTAGTAQAAGGAAAIWCLGHANSATTAAGEYVEVLLSPHMSATS